MRKTFATMPQFFTGVPSIYHHPLRLVQPMPQPQHTEPQKLSLTPRESEVLELLCDAGLDYNLIAEKLTISKGTLRKHLENIFFKLGVTSRFQAVQVHRSEGE
jgi:DNA-binding NarL/FixJ family response regulator